MNDLLWEECDLLAQLNLWLTEQRLVLSCVDDFL